MADPKMMGRHETEPDARGRKAPYERPASRVFTEEEILAQLGPGQLYTGALPFEF